MIVLGWLLATADAASIEATLDAASLRGVPMGPGAAVLVDAYTPDGFSFGAAAGLRQLGLSSLDLRLDLAPAAGWTLGYRKDRRVLLASYVLPGFTLAVLHGRASYPSHGVDSTYNRVGLAPAIQIQESLRIRVGKKSGPRSWAVSVDLDVPVYPFLRLANDLEGRLLGVGIAWSPPR